MKTSISTANVMQWFRDHPYNHEQMERELGYIKEHLYNARLQFEYEAPIANLRLDMYLRNDNFSLDMIEPNADGTFSGRNIRKEIKVDFSVLPQDMVVQYFGIVQRGAGAEGKDDSRKRELHNAMAGVLIKELEGRGVSFDNAEVAQILFRRVTDLWLELQSPTREALHRPSHRARILDAG